MNHGGGAFFDEFGDSELFVAGESIIGRNADGGVNMTGDIEQSSAGSFYAAVQTRLRDYLGSVRADPVLVYFLFKWIKKHYHRDHEDSDFVRGNLKDLTNTYRSLTRKAKGGEEDPLAEGAHSGS